MKKLLSLIAILAFAAVASAGVSSHINMGVTGPDGPDRDMFYTQGPWILGACNCSADFGAENADDIPDDLVGMSFNQVGTYLIQWGGGEHDPVSVTINIYDAECPPAQAPVMSYTFLWSELYTENQNDPSYWVYYIEALLPDLVVIDQAMSIGFVVDMGHGTADPPYVGTLQVDYVSGCGDVYWDAEYWGYARWTSYFDYSGYYHDLAYSLGSTTTATEASDWTQVKALY